MCIYIYIYMYFCFSCVDTLDCWEAAALARLNLSGCGVGDEGAAALAASLPRAPRLRSLNLRKNGLSQAGCERICAAVEETSLTELSLAGNAADEHTLRRLEAALVKNALRTSGAAVDLRACGLGDTAAAALAEAIAASGSSHVTSLDLRGNDLSAAAADLLCRALASNRTLVQVTLAGCPVEGTPPARRLAGRLAANALRSASPSEALRVAGDRGLGDEGAAEIADFLSEPAGGRLTLLCLQHNGIGPAGAQALAAALPGASRLQELLLHSNALGSEGVAALAAALPRQLTALDVGGNAIGDEGAAALALALASHESLRELHLDYDGVGEEGAGRLLDALLSNRSLTSLWLHGNEVSEKTAARLEWAVESNRTDREAALEAADICLVEGEDLEGPPQRPCEQVLSPVEAVSSGPGTCAFADVFAALAVRTYLGLAAEHAMGARGQTVVAAIATHEPGRSTPLRVVALGSGTKFMPSGAAMADNFRRRRVRDSHAEILARRAFKRFLYAQVRELVAGGPGEGCLEPGEAGGRYRLRRGVTLHLYVSTAPCGAASAGPAGADPTSLAGGAGVPGEPGGPEPSGLGPDEFPAPSAAPASAPLELHAKGTGLPGAPPGCRPLRLLSEAVGVDGVSLCCSDKIAVWQSLGLEGALLSHLVDGPLRLSTITVGRKFDTARCEAALRWGGPLAVLRTGVSLEATAAALRGPGSGQPTFEKGDGDESLSWAWGDAAVAQHDGRTGAVLSSGWERVPDGAPSVAGARLFRELAELQGLLGQEVFGSYLQAKQGAESHREARQALLAACDQRAEREGQRKGKCS